MISFSFHTEASSSNFSISTLPKYSPISLSCSRKGIPFSRQPCWSRFQKAGCQDDRFLFQVMLRPNHTQPLRSAMVYRFSRSGQREGKAFHYTIKATKWFIQSKGNALHFLWTAFRFWSTDINERFFWAYDGSAGNAAEREAVIEKGRTSAYADTHISQHCFWNVWEMIYSVQRKCPAFPLDCF